MYFKIFFWTLRICRDTMFTPFKRSPGMSNLSSMIRLTHLKTLILDFQYGVEVEQCKAKMQAIIMHHLLLLKKKNKKLWILWKVSLNLFLSRFSLNKAFQPYYVNSEVFTMIFRYLKIYWFLNILNSIFRDFSLCYF